MPDSRYTCSNCERCPQRVLVDGVFTCNLKNQAAALERLLAEIRAERLCSPAEEG